MALQLTGANVLLLIRNGVANNLASLCPQFGFEADNYTSMYVSSKLSTLEHAGLIVRSGDTYTVSEAWKATQAALDISLTEAASITPGSLVVQPYFGSPALLANPIDVFVVMPFVERLRPVWEDHIKRSIEEQLHLRIARADDFFSSHSVMSDIWHAMYTARVIVADCTGRNPNVFYEIGIAHTIGKPVVLITQKATDVPFDLRYIRYIEYDYTPRGMQIFQESLVKTVSDALA